MTEYKLPGSPTRYSKIENLYAASRSRSIAPECIEYTVQDALDGGNIFLRTHSEEGHPVKTGKSAEIGLAPALLAKFNGGTGQFNAILTRSISGVKDWTWMEFEKAHLLYLAATMSALIKEQGRFQEVSLRTYLRNVKPTNSSLLSDRLILSSRFDGANYCEDTLQCIPRSNAKAGNKIEIEFSDFEHVHLTCDGTPIVDGYQNLKFETSSAVDAIVRSMFIQYKHSCLRCQTSDIHVSTMNQEVMKLKSRLTKHKWPTSRGFIFLWVTNRTVVSDVAPCRELLWVERSTLAEHAPLLGTRGLVPLEELRQTEE